MSVARKDDRHNEDLVAEIADSFTRAVNAKRTEDSGEAEQQDGSAERAEPGPAFVVTGDQRTQPPRRDRRQR